RYGPADEELPVATIQTPSRARWRLLTTLAAVLLLVTAGVFIATHRSTGRGSTGTAGRPDPAGVAHTHGGVTAGAALAAPDFALRLQSLLGQHSQLAADMMRGRIRGDEDFAQAANSALGRNTDAITQLIGSSFGTPAATRFRDQWTAHITALFTYARGLADHDSAVSDQARTALASFEANLAAFFADASQGRLSRDAAQAAVQAHVTHLL